MKILIALILILNSALAVAEPSGADSYDFNAMAFQKTRALCQSADQDTDEPKSDIDYLALLKFAGGGVKTGFLFWRKDSFRVTPETADLVRSDGFKSALYACFGNNATAQQAFKASILALDFLGHLVGMSLWLVPTTVVARVFRNTQWAMANPKVIKAFGKFISYSNRVGLAVVVGVMGFQAWDSYQLHADSKQRLSELTESLVDSTKQESEDSYSILQDLLNDTNKELQQIHPGDPKEQTLLKRKAILEERLKNHHVPDTALN